MRTIDNTPKWTLRRPGCLAEVSCEIDVLLDANDVDYHAIRVTLNDEVVYDRLHDCHSAAERDAAETLRDLLAAGWRNDGGWLRSMAAQAKLLS